MSHPRDKVTPERLGLSLHTTFRIQIKGCSRISLKQPHSSSLFTQSLLCIHTMLRLKVGLNPILNRSIEQQYSQQVFKNGVFKNRMFESRTFNNSRRRRSTT